MVFIVRFSVHSCWIYASDVCSFVVSAGVDGEGAGVQSLHDVWTVPGSQGPLLRLVRPREQVSTYRPARVNFGGSGHEGGMGGWERKGSFSWSTARKRKSVMWMVRPGEPASGQPWGDVGTEEGMSRGEGKSQTESFLSGNDL